VLGASARETHLRFEEKHAMSSEKFDHDTHYHELGGDEARKKIAELVKGIHICMMTTVREDGSMSARPMALQDEPFDGSMWFLTRVTSDKVDEIRNDQHILLGFADKSDSKYVTLRGRAQVNQDKAKIHELWNDMYKAWFPKGEDDPDIAVVRVDVADGDYWEASGMKVVMLAKYAMAAMTGGKMPVGEAGHLKQ
jgi:general stress protein 26